MATMTYTTELVQMVCWCGQPFALSAGLYDAYKRRVQPTLHCPVGHSMVPAGKSDKEKLREAETRERALRDQLESAGKSNAALRGEITKAKKRAKAGVCPCCHRSFVQMARHMQTKHPEFAKGK